MWQEARVCGAGLIHPRVGGGRGVNIRTPICSNIENKWSQGASQSILGRDQQTRKRTSCVSGSLSRRAIPASYHEKVSCVSPSVKENTFPLACGYPLIAMDQPWAKSVCRYPWSSHRNPWVVHYRTWIIINLPRILNGWFMDIYLSRIHKYATAIHDLYTKIPWVDTPWSMDFNHKCQWILNDHPCNSSINCSWVFMDTHDIAMPPYCSILPRPTLATIMSRHHPEWIEWPQN